MKMKEIENRLCIITSRVSSPRLSLAEREEREEHSDPNFDASLCFYLRR